MCQITCGKYSKAHAHTLAIGGKVGFLHLVSVYMMFA